MSSAGILCSMAATRIAKDHGDQEAQLGFATRPPIHTWWDYAIIMWQDDGPELAAPHEALPR